MEVNKEKFVVHIETSLLNTKVWEGIYGIFENIESAREWEKRFWKGVNEELVKFSTAVIELGEPESDPHELAQRLHEEAEEFFEALNMK